jgi:uncharacterized membrane protein YhaH (DUF805 family)
LQICRTPGILVVPALNFIPVIGGLLVLIFMCLPGTAGDNQYGADPAMSELNS